MWQGSKQSKPRSSKSPGNRGSCLFRSFLEPSRTRSTVPGVRGMCARAEHQIRLHNVVQWCLQSRRRRGGLGPGVNVRAACEAQSSSFPRTVSPSENWAGDFLLITLTRTYLRQLSAVYITTNNWQGRRTRWENVRNNSNATFADGQLTCTLFIRFESDRPPDHIGKKFSSSPTSRVFSIRTPKPIKMDESHERALSADAAR